MSLLANKHDADLHNTSSALHTTCRAKTSNNVILQDQYTQKKLKMLQQDVSQSFI